MRIFLILPSSISSSCRFCLKQFKEDEKQIVISHYIEKQFFFITQMELSQSAVYSQNICETCFDLSRDLAAFREQLIQIQKSLEEAFGDGSNAGCDVLEEEVFNGEVLIKVEPVDATNDDEDVEDSNDDRAEAIESLYEDHSEDPSMQESLNPHTSNDEQPTAPKRKMCEICGVWYSSLNFKRHFDRVHLKRKNFCCDICNQTFKKADMVNHVRSHFKVSWAFIE